MEVNLNSNTTIDVESKVTIVKTTSPTSSKVDKILYLNNDKIFATDLSFIRFYNFKTFFISLIIGVVLAGGYYLYQTMYANMPVDYLILGGLVALAIIIGFIKGFQRKRHLIIIVEPDNFGLFTKSRFSFPVSKNVSDKNLEDLMYQLVS